MWSQQSPLWPCLSQLCRSPSRSCPTPLPLFPSWPSLLQLCPIVTVTLAVCRVCRGWWRPCYACRCPSQRSRLSLSGSRLLRLWLSPSLLAAMRVPSRHGRPCRSQGRQDHGCPTRGRAGPIRVAAVLVTTMAVEVMAAPLRLRRCRPGCDHPCHGRGHQGRGGPPCGQLVPSGSRSSLSQL